MRGLFSRAHASFDQTLIVESGPREITETLLRHVYEVQQSRRVDLVTCYGGTPTNFDLRRGSIFSIQEAEIAQTRHRFVRKLTATPYTATAILCTGTPILEKWKWLIALRTRAKVVIVNEHGDFFPLDFRRWRLAKQMLANRLGTPHALDAGTFAELLLVPFTLVFLLMYAGAVHGRRLMKFRAGYDRQI